MSFRDRRQKCIDVVMMQEPARARVDPKSQGGPDKRAPEIGWAAETLFICKLSIIFNANYSYHGHSTLFNIERTVSSPITNDRKLRNRLIELYATVLWPGPGDYF